MPHKEPFLFLESAKIDGSEATATYKISGNEYFLEGHFKENPVFPASIMIEALGQLCVFFLLKGEDASIISKVDPNTIFFTSCDGVKCRRICKPGDKLTMKVQVSRIRHPLACFTGEINVEGERTAHAEEIKLAFDYFPIIDAQDDVNEKKSTSAKSFRNGGGNMSNGSNGNTSDSESPERFVKFNQNS
jgi:3-hydroxyacyl-[acyl-carrier-protein] dehydratase